MSPSRDEWPPACLSCGVGSGKQLWITLKSVWGEQNPKGRLSKKRGAGRVLGPAGRRKVQLRKAVQGRPEHPSAAHAGRCSLSHRGAQRRMDMAISRSWSWAGEGGETIQNNRTTAIVVEQVKLQELRSKIARQESIMEEAGLQ